LVSATILASIVTEEEETLNYYYICDKKFNSFNLAIMDSLNFKYEDNSFQFVQFNSLAQNLI
jgi:hypothetical protein